MGQKDKFALRSYSASRDHMYEVLLQVVETINSMPDLDPSRRPVPPNPPRIHHRGHLGLTPPTCTRREVQPFGSMANAPSTVCSSSAAGGSASHPHGERIAWARQSRCVHRRLPSAPVRASLRWPNVSSINAKISESTGLHSGRARGPTKRYLSDAVRYAAGAPSVARRSSPSDWTRRTSTMTTRPQRRRLQGLGQSADPADGSGQVIWDPVMEQANKSAVGRSIPHQH